MASVATREKPDAPDAAANVAIDVHGLSKSFGGRKVVSDLSMQVKRGQIYGFLGPNGSGKTTTIRMLCGLLTPDKGEGTCLGYNIRKDADRIRRHVGYMTQRFSLYQDLSVRENLEFVARLYGLASPRSAARDMIKRLGLDPKARREFWNEIHALAHDGLTVLVSTHYMDEAERCHEIAYIAYGQLLTHGTVEQVIASSALHTYTVNGDDLNGLQTELTGKPGIDMVAPFGNSLHVSGRDAQALEATIAPYRARGDLNWQPSEPSLEDVFIELMNRAQDNFR
jgi:ABC-2 type transport system ATP-binding protein